MVVAGENHDSGKKFEEYQDVYSKLEQWARKRWTSAGEMVSKWTGQASEILTQILNFNSDSV